MSAGPPWSRTMKQASVSATDQGGGKRRRSVTRPDNAPGLSHSPMKKKKKKKKKK